MPTFGTVDRVAALLALATALAAQDPAPAPPLRLELVAADDAVVPGRTLTLGLRLLHAPGWHTYWKNAGTVGMAPRVTWRLPAGCKAGPLLWQQPQLSKMGVYTVWGYEGEALHLCDITVPPDVEGDHLRFEAKVDFLVCARTCAPGTETVTLDLPRREATREVAPWRRRFAAVRSQQPAPPGRAWRVTARRAESGYVLILTPGEDANPKIARVQFFGDDRLVSSNEAQALRREADGRLVLTLAREEFSPEDHARLRGLLHCAAGFRSDGTVTALRVDVPLAKEE